MPPLDDRNECQVGGAKKEKFQWGETLGYEGRNLEAGGSQSHQGNPVSLVVNECSDGEEIKWKVEDVCELYGSKEY